MALRLIMSIVFPPLSVLDKGCGVTLLVGMLWLMGLVPGIIAALVINLFFPEGFDNQRRYVEIPTYQEDEAKRKGAYVRLADGETAEVVDDDGLFPHSQKRKPES
jgi:uncharacterized membrane protein YqaE (UPF0057 family)